VAGGRPRPRLGPLPLAAYLAILLGVFIVATSSGAAYVRWQSEGDALDAPSGTPASSPS